MWYRPESVKKRGLALKSESQAGLIVGYRRGKTCCAPAVVAALSIGRRRL